MALDYFIKLDKCTSSTLILVCSTHIYHMEFIPRLVFEGNNRALFPITNTCLVTCFYIVAGPKPRVFRTLK